MDFQELKNTAFNLVTSGDSSVADYLTCYRQTENYKEKLLKELPEYTRHLRVAFLSNFTIQGLPEVFKVQGIFHNLWLETYLAPYNQYAQEILNPDSGLNKFKPELVYFILDPIENQLSQLYDLAFSILEKTRAKKVVFLSTRMSSFGNNEFIKFVNLSERLSELGLGHHWNTKYKELADMRLAPDALPALSEELMKDAVAVSGATKKCLVTDLDNTLWQGIVGEDDEIVPKEELQRKILTLYEQGIVLAINSRNNEADVFQIIDNHPKMILRKDHFAAWRINWQDKVQNMGELAQEMNLGLESFVFIDDDPFQQNAVQASYPEITVLSPEQLENYSGFFGFGITEEDKGRGRMYTEERKRRALQASLKTVHDFLRELNLQALIKFADSGSLPRIAQLTQKTNQFNLATRRYSEGEIKKSLDGGSKIWTLQAQDKFGDYGIVGVAMVEPRGELWRIDNFMLSCRILGRGIEKTFLNFVLETAREAGAKTVAGEFIPTAKNKPCATFYADNNFEFKGRAGDTNLYHYDLKSFNVDYPNFIKVTFV